MKNYTKKDITKYRTVYRNDENQFHRLDGPAIEWIDGTKFWYINGKYYTEQEFQQYLKMQEAKQLLGVKDV